MNDTIQTRIEKLKIEIKTAKALNKLGHSDRKIGKMLEISTATATSRYDGSSNRLVLKLREKQARNSRIVRLRKKNWTLKRISDKIGNISHSQVKNILDKA